MRVRRTFAAAVVSVATMAGIVAMSPQAASAATNGCTGIGPKSEVQGIGVSDGESCVMVSKQGLLVKDVYASWFTATTKICNWWMDIDTNAEEPAYRHFQGSFHNGCTRFSGIIDPGEPAFWSKPGRICATVYSDAIVKAKSCVSVHT